jgi:hypothetical protein
MRLDACRERLDDGDSGRAHATEGRNFRVIASVATVLLNYSLENAKFRVNLN